MTQTTTSTLAAAPVLNTSPQNADRKATFDPKVLKAKYEHERDKRLARGGGLEQYRTMEDGFSHMLKDPFAGKSVVRDPVKMECEALVIGGGYGAMLVAIELMKAGVEDVRIIEKGGDFGGTWYWNRYPGAQCDIESYVYMPLLEEMDYIPTRKYAGGKELLCHAQAIGKKFGLYERATFQTEVKSLHWHEEAGRWDVKTDRGDTFSSRFVIPAAGPLHQPKLPALPGLGDFQGHTFHTSRWDYQYTGGDPANPPEQLVNLSDKRVGVIGTGATAVQIVPHLGNWAKELYVFQRTPSSIDVRGNKATDPEWVASLGDHWQRKRMDNFNTVVNGGNHTEDLVSDGWTDILRRLRGASLEKTDPKRMLYQRQMLDFEKMERIRSRVDDSVADVRTAESLKPWYNQFCKRPCFHDDYLPTFNKPNVHLIDTDGKGVDRLTDRGVVANGEEVALDCLIFATGFQLATSWTKKSGIEVYGREGLSLSEKWADGPSTLHGHSTRSFPNCFFVQNTQAALSPNFLHITAFQAEHISYIIKSVRERGSKTVTPTQQAEDSWVSTIVSSQARRKAHMAMDCTPGYYNNEGQRSAALDKKAGYGGGPLEFMRMMTEWREAGELAGLELEGRK